MKTYIFIFFVLTGNLILAQEDYDLLYIKGEHNKIFAKSQKMETHEDYYWNSIILDKKGNTLDAIEILYKGISEFDNVKEIETLLSDFLYESGQYLKAKSLLEKHLDTPDRILKHISVLEFQEEYLMAIEMLQREMLVETANLDYLTHLGNNYSRIDNLELAIKEFFKILIINPNDQLIAAKLANLLIKNKDYSRAVEICNIGLSSDSTNRKLVKLKGIASFNKPDFHTDKYCFRYLYEQGDSSKFTLKHLGISEFSIKSFQASREYLLQAFNIDSNDYEICYIIGKCFLNSPEPEQGLPFFNRVDSLLQPDPKILSALNIEKQSIYSSIENYEKALECYNIAYEYNPKPEYVFYMASIHQNRLNDKRKALEEYERFLSILPEKND